MQTKNENEDIVKKPSDNQDVDNLPIDVKTKLNDLIKKNDIIDSIVKQLEFKSFKDFDSQVIIILL
jgi:translation initiation factor RLI1